MSKFSAKHIGSNDERTLRTKGAHTFGIIVFLASVMTLRGSGLADRVPIGGVLQAGRALINIIQIWDTSGAVMTAAGVRQTFDSWGTFSRAVSDLGFCQIPKLHQACHLLQMQDRLGNPARFANWRDESLNKMLKAACRKVSQVNFESGVLLRMRVLLAPQSGSKRKADAP